MSQHESRTQAVLRTLLADHVGEHNAVTQAQLAEATGVNPSTLRSELRRLREQRGIPIGNQRDGYYVISDKEELQQFVGHLNSEIESKKRTIEHTLEAFEQFDREALTDGGVEAAVPTYECNECGAATERDDAKYPKALDADGPLCQRCYGRALTNGGGGR